MRSLIEIPAADVENAGLAIDMALPAAWITAQTEDAEAYASTDGKLVARLSRTGRDIVVRGTVTATVDVPCARCLKPTTIDVEGELALLLKPNPALIKTKAALAGALRASKAGGDKPGAEGKLGKTAKAAAKAAGGVAAGGVAAKPAKKLKEGDADEPAARRMTRTRALVDRTPPAASGSERGAERGKTARIEEYEFSAEEAEHDEYDGDTVVLDGFVREAILLELPNFPLCSETCAGISPRLSVPWGDAPSGGGASSGAPVRANPFEALKHLAGGLPKGPELTDGAGASENGAGSHFAFERAGSSDGNAKKRPEPKLASTHNVPIRKGASKKKSAGKGASANGPKKPTKPTKH